MLFWLFIYIIVFFSIFYYNKLTLILLWILLFLISAFRYNVGTDYHSYKDMYIAFQTGNVPLVWELKEPGFTYLIKLLNILDLNFQALFILTSAIIISLFYFISEKIFTKYDEKFVYLLLFIPLLYLTSLNVIRQFVAISLFGYSLIYLIQNSKIKYYMTIISAIMFHYSALILLPIYFIANIKLKRAFIVIIVFLIVVSLFIDYMKYLQIFLDTFHIRYAFYLNNGIAEKNEVSKISFFISLFISFILLSFLNRKNKIENIIFNISLYLLLVQSLVFQSEIAGRLAFYYKFIYLIMIVFVYKNIKIKFNFNSQKILLTIILLFSFSYLLFSSYVRGLKDQTYSHYAVNFDLFGKGYPMEIYDGRN